MSKKSAIDMIEELYIQFASFNKRLEVIEQNMKEVLNRANLLAREATSSIKVSQPKQPSPAKVEKPVAPKIKKNTTKVIGKIKGKDDRPLIGVQVTVYNDKNTVVKQTRTNRAGDWMCFLPPGRYGAECFMKDKIQANITFAVTPGSAIVRAPRPIV